MGTARLTGEGFANKRCRMKRGCAILLVAAAAALAAQSAMSTEGSYGPVEPDRLTKSEVGSFPPSWRTWPMQRGKAAKVYSVAEENGRIFIRAQDDEELSQQIFLNFDWDVAKRPVLSWRWRATKLPEGAAESNDATNDSACGVYAVFGRYSGNAIKYVWSTGLPAGRVVERRGGKLKIKVLDSGPAKVGSWVSRSADVAKDYEELFGRPLEKNPSGIGLLTDGNAVGKPAGCDYAVSGRKR
jgi:hypothetical protein